MSWDGIPFSELAFADSEISPPLPTATPELDGELAVVLTWQRELHRRVGGAVHARVTKGAPVANLAKRDHVLIDAAVVREASTRASRMRASCALPRITMNKKAPAAPTPAPSVGVNTPKYMPPSTPRKSVRTAQVRPSA